MIYYQTIYPESMAGELLDRFLAAGWYRIGQSFITTDLITQNEMLVPVFWLRIRLETYQPSRSARRIWAGCASFETEIIPFAITEEIEALYTRYRASVSHTISPTVRDYLLDGGERNAFESRLITVRDKGQLIAAGYFDVGAACSTGILHIFDPDRPRESLGKFLYLQEISYSLRHGHDFYYPGYMSTETDKFDYKLFADRFATEVYLRPLARWLAFDSAEQKLRRWGQKIMQVTRRFAPG